MKDRDIQAFLTIAEIMGIMDTKARRIINDPYKTIPEDEDILCSLENRGVDMDNDEEEKIVGFALVEKMLSEKIVAEVDWKEDCENSRAILEQILPSEIPFDTDDIMDNDEPVDWLRRLGEVAEDAGYIVVGFDVNTDSYVFGFCPEEQYPELSRATEIIGMHIDFAWNL